MTNLRAKIYKFVRDFVEFLNFYSNFDKLMYLIENLESFMPHYQTNLCTLIKTVTVFSKFCLDFQILPIFFKKCKIQICVAYDKKMMQYISFSNSITH